MNIPTISKKDMTKLDQLMVEKYKIGIIQMMELAGFNTAELSRRILKRVSKKHIVILCGKGNNGGDGLVLLATSTIGELKSPSSLLQMISKLNHYTI